VEQALATLAQNDAAAAASGYDFAAETFITKSWIIDKKLISCQLCKACHMSHITSHRSLVTRHTSHITHDTSQVTRHTLRSSWHLR
jgi:hypothetical protein